MPVPSTAHPSVRISGKDIREFGIELTEYPSLMMPDVRARQQVIPGRAGAIDFGGAYQEWDFTVRGQIRGSSHQDFVTKFRNFKRWIDIAPRVTQEFVTNQRSIKALAFELSGHEYHYTEGTISISNNDNRVTGSGTEFSKYAFPGAKLTINDGSHSSSNRLTKYYVESVTDDTDMYLTSTVTPAVSNASYMLERRAFLLVNYVGPSSIRNIGGEGGHFIDQVYPVEFTFRAVYPVWIGDQWIQSATDQEDFWALGGLGNAPFNPVWSLSGVAASPSVTIAKHSYVSGYDEADPDSSAVPKNARMIKNDSDQNATTFNSTEFNRQDSVLTDVGAAVYFTGWGNPTSSNDETIEFYADPSGRTGGSESYSPVVDMNQGSIALWVRPEWEGDDGLDHNFFRCGDGTGNELKIRKDGPLDNRFVFSWETAGQNVYCYYTPSSIQPGNWYHIVVVWSVRNSNLNGSGWYSQIYVNNNAGTVVGTVTPTTGDLANFAWVGDYNGSRSPANAAIADVAVFDRPLSTTEIAALYGSGDGPKAGRYSDSLSLYMDFDGADQAEGTSLVASNVSSYRLPTWQISSIGGGGNDELTFYSTGTPSNAFAAGDRVVVWATDGTTKIETTVSSVDDGTYTVTVGTDCSSMSGKTAYLSGNLAADGQMEMSSIAYWPDLGTPATSAKHQSTGGVYKGEYAITMIANAIGEGVQQTITTASGEDYVIRYWMKMDTGTATMNANNAGGQQLANITGSGFELYEHCVECTSSSMTLQWESDQNNTDYNLDDVEVLPNLLSNGGLEAWTGSTPDDWTKSESGSSTITQVSSTANDTTPTNVHSDSGAATMTVDGSGSQVYIAQNVSVTGGDWYEISMWAKIDSANGSDNIRIGQTIQDGTYHYTDFELTTSWARYSIVVQAGSTGTRSIQIIRNASGSVSRTMEIDDIACVRRPTLEGTFNTIPEENLYVPTKHGRGVYVTPNTTLHYNDLTAVNPAEFGFICRVIPKFASPWLPPSTEGRIILEAYYDNDNYYRIVYQGNDSAGTGRLLTVIHFGSGNAYSYETEDVYWAVDQPLEISGWTKAGGRSIDGTTYHHKMFLNGIELSDSGGSNSWTADAWTEMPSIPIDIAIGNAAASNPSSSSAQANMIFDEVVIFAYAPSDDELIKSYFEDEPHYNESRTFTYSGSLAAGDVLEVNTQTGQHRLHDATDGTLSFPGSSLDGDNPYLIGNEDEEAVVYVDTSADAGVDKIEVTGRAHWR